MSVKLLRTMRFTKPEVCELTGINYDRINYLDRSGLVVPMRNGKGKRPTPLYSFNQMIQILVVEHYKSRFDTEDLIEIVKLIEDNPDFIFSYEYRIFYAEVESLEDENSFKFIGFVHESEKIKEVLDKVEDEKIRKKLDDLQDFYDVSTYYMRNLPFFLKQIIINGEFFERVDLTVLENEINKKVV